MKSFNGSIYTTKLINSLSILTAIFWVELG